MNWLICHTSYSHHSLKDSYSIVKYKLQPYVLSNLPCLFRIQVPARRYHSFQLNYKLYLLSSRHVCIRRWVCCLMTSFTTIYFFCGTVIIPQEYLKQTILLRALYFEKPIAAIHHIKRTGFTSRTTAQKMKFSPLSISSVNETKSARNWGFGHIYWGNPYWKTPFFVQWTFERCYVYLRKAIAASTFLRYLFFPQN